MCGELGHPAKLVETAMDLVRLGLDVEFVWSELPSTAQPNINYGRALQLLVPTFDPTLPSQVIDGIRFTREDPDHPGSSEHRSVTLAATCVPLSLRLQTNADISKMLRTYNSDAIAEVTISTDRDPSAYTRQIFTRTGGHPVNDTSAILATPIRSQPPLEVALASFQDADQRALFEQVNTLKQHGKIHLIVVYNLKDIYDNEVLRRVTLAHKDPIKKRPTVIFAIGGKAKECAQLTTSVDSGLLFATENAAMLGNKVSEMHSSQSTTTICAYTHKVPKPAYDYITCAADVVLLNGGKSLEDALISRVPALTFKGNALQFPFRHPLVDAAEKILCNRNPGPVLPDVSALTEFLRAVLDPEHPDHYQLKLSFRKTAQFMHNASHQACSRILAAMQLLAEDENGQ